MLRPVVRPPATEQGGGEEAENDEGAESPEERSSG